MTVSGEPWPSFDIRPPRTSPEQVAWPGSVPSFSDLVAFCNEHAVTEDNVVTAEVATASDLADLMTNQLRKVHSLAPDRPGGWQELKCAADVAEALAAVTLEADEAEPQPLAVFLSAPLPGLLCIPVIVLPDSAPGTWRLVTHDHCEVRGEHPGAWVSHGRCTIAAEGRLG